MSIPPLSALVFYLFGPALVFNSMSKTELSADLGARVVITSTLVSVLTLTMLIDLVS